MDVAALPAELSTGLLLDGGAPVNSVVFVELHESARDDDLARAATAARASRQLIIGLGRGPLGTRFDALGSSLALTLVDEAAESAPWQVGVPSVDDARDGLIKQITDWPIASHTLDRLLRITAEASVDDGLTAESLAYSMLMAGAEHQRWLAARTRKPIPSPTAPPVLLERDGNTLRIVLNRPERHNAFGREMRDGMSDAFELVEADDTIERVDVSGAGRSFCSGGDLDEFGLSADVTVAHLIRLDRLPAPRLARIADRVYVHLHGACIGAGIELASYAARVTAQPDAHIRLPEISMGLVPGAGGTVGITKRIGRWRTAYLALSGEPLPLPTAVRWGLVDELTA